MSWNEAERNDYNNDNKKEIKDRFERTSGGILSGVEIITDKILAYNIWWLIKILTVVE